MAKSILLIEIPLNDELHLSTWLNIQRHRFPDWHIMHIYNPYRKEIKFSVFSEVMASESDLEKIKKELTELINAKD